MHGRDSSNGGTRQGDAGAAAGAPVSIAAMALAGGAATLLGVGLGRFAFTPLFPAMVEAQWVSGGDAAMLGAANLAGYLIGALAAPWVDGRLGRRTSLRASMILVATVACAGALVAPLAAGHLWLAIADANGSFQPKWSQ